MSTPRTLFWLAIAIGEAAGIVAMALLLTSSPTAAAASAAPVAPTDEPAVFPSPAHRSVEDAPTPTPAAPTPAPSAPTDPHANQPALGTLLLGSVHTRAGALVDSAYLNLFAGEDTKACASTSLRRQADFAFAGLVAGDYRLTARVESMRPFEHSFTVAAATEVQRIDVTVEPSWVIKVLLLTPDGKPLAEATKDMKELGRGGFSGPVSVIAAWQPLPAQLPMSEQREAPFSVGKWSASGGMPGRGGGATLPARYAGSLEMTEDRAGVVAAVMRGHVLAEAPVERGQDEVTLTIDPQQMLARLASVRLQVVDAATGAPVADAKVALNESGSWRQPTALDAEGVLQQSKMMPGRYGLNITAEGRVGPPVTVDLEAGRLTDLGPVPVVKAFALRITLTNSTDAEVRGWCCPLDPPSHAAFRADSARVSAQKGEIKASLWPGRYQLRLTGKGVGALLEFDTQKLGDAPLQVELKPEAALHVDPSKLPEPTHLVLKSANETVMLDRWITWKGKWDVPLPPGNYHYTLQALHGPVRTGTVAVAADGANLTLQ